MTTYFDTGALVPIYVPEAFSEAAEDAVRKASAVPYTAIHELEMANAFELLLARGRITRNEYRALQRNLRDDLHDRRLVRVTLDLPQVFMQATELSRLYAAKFLARSLDLLHVAAAHAAACARFVSGDDRQLAMAESTGLRIIDIRRAKRRR